MTAFRHFVVCIEAVYSVHHAHFITEVIRQHLHFEMFVVHTTSHNTIVGEFVRRFTTEPALLDLVAQRDFEVDPAAPAAVLCAVMRGSDKANL